MEKQDIPRYSYNWFISRFEEVNDETSVFLATLDEEEFTTKPSPDVWSVAECFEHVNEFNRIYLQQIESGLDNISTDGAEIKSTFPPRMFFKWVVSFFEPPYKIKIKTISSFDPAESDHILSLEEVNSDFRELQDRFLFCLRRSMINQLDLSEKKANNPVLTFIRMRLSECFAVVDAHQRRHLWQAKQIRRHLEQNR